MSISTSFRIVIRAASQFSAHGGTQMGAALAYYALFSTAPLLILAVMLAGLFVGEDAAQGHIHTFLTRVFSSQTANELVTWMDETARPEGGTLAAVLGIVLLVLGALGAFLHVRNCLYVIWRLETPGGNGIFLTMFNYFLASIAALCVGLLLLLSLAVSTAVVVLGKTMEKDLPGGATLWKGVDIGLSFLMLTLFFAVVYHVLSGRRIAWGYAWYGAFIAAFLFTIGKTLISLYLAHTSTVSVYGAAGSVVIFLVWVYYCSQIVFFGAELIQARRTRAEWLGEGQKRM